MDDGGFNLDQNGSMLSIQRRIEESRPALNEGYQSRTMDEALLTHGKYTINKPHSSYSDTYSKKNSISTKFGKITTETKLLSKLNSDRRGAGTEIPKTDRLYPDKSVRKLINSITNISINHVDTNKHETNRKFILDSGSSAHITSDPSLLSERKPVEFRKSLLLRNNQRCPVTSIGNIVLPGVTLKKTCHAPTLPRNIISAGQIVKTGLTMIATSNGNVKFLRKDKSIVLTGYIDSNNIMYTDLPYNEVNTTTRSINWHSKLGHIANDRIKNMSKFVNGINESETYIDSSLCSTCVSAKAKRAPISKIPAPLSTTKLNLIHSDICGPMTTQTKGGAQYFVTFTDDYTRFTWVYILKKKSDLYSVFESYLSFVENSSGHKVKRLRSDCGGEYTSTQLQNILNKRGILHQTTAPHTPEHNGVAERKNRTLVEMATAMLLEFHLPPYLWGEAIIYSTFLLNMAPTKAIIDATPYIAWHNTKPDISNIHTFGCTAYVLRDTDRHKFEAKTRIGTYLGPNMKGEGDRIYMTDTNKVIISRSVTYDETTSPLKQTTDEPGRYLSITPGASNTTLNNYFNTPFNPTPAFPTQNTTPITPPTKNPIEIDTPEMVEIPLFQENTNDNNNIPDVDEDEFVLPAIISQQIPSNIESRRSNRLHDNEESKIPETKSRQFYLDPDPPKIKKRKQNQSRTIPAVSADVIPTITVTAPTPTDTLKKTVTFDEDVNITSISNEDYINNVLEFVPKSQIHNTELSNQTDPLTVTDALSREDRDKWQAAMDTEYNALMANGTWEIVPLPNDRKAIGCKWVFKIKRNPDFTIDKYKARLVAKGFAQRWGIDYAETYAPTAKMVSIRTFLALAAAEGLEVDQCDVASAYLNGKMDTVLYMTQPEGYTVGNPNEDVCLIHKGLYGFKQGGRNWNIELDQHMKVETLLPLASDPCIYKVKTDDGVMLYVAVYVDDMLIASNRKYIDWFKNRLRLKWKISDLGQAKYCVGIEIKQTKGSISITQGSYIRRIVKELGMEDAIPTTAPLSPDDANSLGTEKPGEEGKPIDPKIYRSFIGKLMYAMVGSRPDIAFAVSKLGQFACNPTSKHLKLAKKVLCYLKGTADKGIVYLKHKKNLVLDAYSDADWGGCKTTRRSTTGGLFRINGSLVSWSSKRQPTVALSSTEAEYMAATQATKEVVWLRRFLSEVNHEQPTPTIIYEDNNGAIELSKNPIDHVRTKHIDIQYHFVREKVDAKEVKLIHVPTKDQLADLMTKALVTTKFTELVNRMGLVNINTLN